MDFKILSIIIATLAASTYLTFFLVAKPTLNALFGSVFDEHVTKHVVRLQLLLGGAIAVMVRVGTFFQEGNYYGSNSSTSREWAVGTYFTKVPVSFDDWFAFIGNNILTVGLVITVQLAVLFLWTFAGIVMARRSSNLKVQ